MYKVNIQNFTRILFLVFLLFRFCGNSFASEHNIPQNIHQDVQEQYGNNVNTSSNAKVQDIILKKQNNVIAICCDKECFKLEHLFGVGVNIINNNFVNDVYAVECNDELLNNFIAKYLRNMQHKILYKEDDKYIENNVRLFVLITVNPGEKRYLVYCENANSKKVGDIFYGLFQGSKATVIEILSCGNNITNMRNMFNNCFQNKATLICKVSTIQKITDNGGSCLIIPNEKKSGFENIIGNNNNPEQVYTCSVKRVGNNPQITDVKEYTQQQYNAKLHK